MAKLAILVINYNGYSRLGRLFIECLSSLAEAAAYASDVDVWLVDNGSTDGSPEVVLSKLNGAVNVFRLKRNLGYGAACNLALRRLHNRGYEFYACSNNDIVFFRESLSELLDWLMALSERFQKGFLASPLLVNGFDGLIDFGGYFLDLSGSTWPLRVVAECAEKVKELMRGRPILVSYVDGAFLAFPGKLGWKLFNSRFFLYYEDVELSLRLWARGIPSLLLPVILGFHFRSSTTSRLPAMALYSYMRNRAYTVCKFYGARGLMRMLLWYLLYPTRSLTPSPGVWAASVAPVRGLWRAALRGLLSGLTSCVREGFVEDRAIAYIDIPLSAYTSWQRLLHAVARAVVRVLGLGP